MVTFGEMREWFDQRFGESAESPMPRYILMGVLGAVILGCLIFWVAALFPGGGGRGTREAHFWCVETEKEYVLGPGQFSEEDMQSMAAMEGRRLKNPDTGKSTLIPMNRCPKCEKYFVTEAQLKADPDHPEQTLADTKLVCTHCKIDVRQWFRENRRKGR